MGTESGFLSSHAAATGSALVQTTPHIQAVNGEAAVDACQLMSIRPADGKAYLCNLAAADCVPAGFAATDNPLDTAVDDTTKITLIRQGRTRGFSGMVPGAVYYPSGDVPGGIVPERATAGPVITAVAASSGSAFLRNVHIRAGHRPAAGEWTITFPTATTCTVTPPGGSALAASTVAANTAYNGTITGAADFYIETRTLTGGDIAVVTVAYDTPAAAVATLDSAGNAFTAAVALDGAAGRGIVPGLYTLVTSGGGVTVTFNGGDPSPALAIAAATTCVNLIPGIALTTEAEAVTAETNYFIVTAQEPAAPVGLAVNATTLQVLMGGNG